MPDSPIPPHAPMAPPAPAPLAPAQQDPLAPAHPGESPGGRLTAILTLLANQPGRTRVSAGDLVDALDGRAFGALLLIFAFPNLLPTPPGTAGITGLPILFLSTQMMLGRMPWLPKFILNRSMTIEAFRNMLDRGGPWLIRAERMLKSRLDPLSAPLVQQGIGAFCLLLAIILVLPIPFGNLLPASAICIIGLGVLERDGVWILGGLVAGALAGTIVGSMGYALVKGAIFVLLNAF